MPERGGPASNKETQVLRRYVEVAALMIARLFVGAAGAEAQKETAPPSSVVRDGRNMSHLLGLFVLNERTRIENVRCLGQPDALDSWGIDNIGRESIQHQC